MRANRSAYFSAYMKARRAEWKELGICVLCGKRDHMPNRVRCGVCAEQQDTRKQDIALAAAAAKLLVTA